MTAQAARATVKTAATAAKASAKAIAATVKAIIASVKALVAAIAAGGWIAIFAIVIICLIGLFISSPFGIFFSGEDSGTGQTMPTVVREINQDYEGKLEEIKTANTHDVLNEEICTLREQVEQTELVSGEIQASHRRLLSWADMFDTASSEEKKMIASYLVKAVTLTRDYGIQVEFNVSEAQYLGGMEIG